MTAKSSHESQTSTSQVPYQQLVEYAPAGIFHGDKNGQITFTNEHWQSLFELNDTQALGDGWLSAIHIDYRSQFLKQWQQAIKEQDSLHSEIAIKTADNTMRYLRIDTNPIFIDDVFLGFVGHVKDITIRTLAEQNLQRSNDLAQALIDQSRIPYAVREENDRISYINPAFTQTFGYTLEDIHDTEEWYLKAYPDPEYRAKIKHDWNLYLNHIGRTHEITNLETHIVCKDGSSKIVLLSPSKLLGSNMDKFSVSFYDITELKLAQESLEKSQERFALAIRGSGVGIWDWNIETGHVFFSDEFIEELGFKSHEMKGTVDAFYALMHPDDKNKVKQAFDAHIGDKNLPYSIKYRMRHKNGDYQWYQGVGQALKDASGHAYRMSGSHTNISQQMINHERLTLAKMVFDHSGEAIVTTDLHGYIQAINPAFSLITGFEIEDVLNQHLSQLRSDKNENNIVEKVSEALREKGTWSGELWCTHKNHDNLAISVMINAIKNSKGEPQKFIALFTDITEKKQTQEIIWQQAHYDDLTQLLNRNSFTKYINSAVNGDQPFALLFIDLDHFKQVNDTLGHKVGDELLKQASHRLKHCVRASDIVSRFGGDEFTVVLSGVLTEEIIHRICSQIIMHLSAPFDLNGEAAYISASIGITQFPNDSRDVEELYKYADQAMYDAKRNGRNRFSFFTQELQIAADRQRSITSEMRLAVRNNDFHILYQPIVHLPSKRIHKAEALLRWQHKTRGEIPPAEFIPIAEETGLINEIGDWVFKQAALQAKVWRKHHDPSFQVSINKSPVQFYHDADRGHEHWSAFLKTINLSGDGIAVEITEGLLLDSTSQVREKLEDFQKSGIAISLDDFGTGYSALSYLKKFNIDYIKIDRSFVMNLEHDKYDRILCETIISMAHKLGMMVTAEGIENENQKDILQAAGCDYGQGFLFSPAITASELTKLIEEN